MTPNSLVSSRHTSAHTSSRNSRPRYQLRVTVNGAVPGHASSSFTGLTVDRRNGRTLSERASNQQLNKAAAAFGLTIPKFETQHTEPSQSHSVKLTRGRPKSSQRSKSSNSNRNTRRESSGNLSSNSSSRHKGASSCDKDTSNSDTNPPCGYADYLSFDYDCDEAWDSDDEYWIHEEGHYMLPFLGRLSKVEVEELGRLLTDHTTDCDDEGSSDEDQLVTGDGTTLSAVELARVRLNILEAREEFDYWGDQTYDTTS